MSEYTQRLDRHIEETIEENKNIKLLIQETSRRADAAERKADAAWELVIMTRNQISRPWWKRLLGGN